MGNEYAKYSETELDDNSQQKLNTSEQKMNTSEQKLNTSSQQNNERKSFNDERSRSRSRHRGCPVRGGQEKNLQDFLRICDDFEYALKTVDISQKSTNLVHQRLQNIQKTLVEKISILEKSNIDNSVKRRTGKKMSSNLKSDNKSLSSSTSSLHSNKLSKELPNLTSYEEFLKEVNCPYCCERQLDKYYLIKHLDEGCLLFKTNSFERETNLPYSSFQILPNNSFKCNLCSNVVARNLQGYFTHLNSTGHEENFKIKSRSKPCSNFLFCSVCKFIIPDNFTELSMHLGHQQHKARSSKFVSERTYIDKNICSIYYRSGEHYCFVCSRKFVKQNNLEEFMDHLTSDKHNQNLRKKGVNANNSFCEICERELNQFQIWNHFLSPEHGSKALKQKSALYYTICMYCSSDFSNLTELSNHMKSGCKEMEILRNDVLATGCEASGKNAKIKKGVAGKEEVKDGHCVYLNVSGDVDISDLKSYFEKFGRVISLKKLTANKVMIMFKERDTINKLLELKKLIGFDSRILSLDEFQFEKMENQSNQSKSEYESDEENVSNDDDDDDDNDNDDDSKCDNALTEDLFQEVGSHLMKKVENMDSAEDDEILLISQMTLKATMTFSGFRGCHLVIPNETRLNLHCQFEPQSYNSVLEDLLLKKNMKRVEKDSVELNIGLSQVALTLMEKSPFWKDVECITTPIPYVKCTNKRTRKSCVITFSDSDRELTEALSACLKENDFIKPFLLTLKLWLSSQQTFLSDIEYPFIAVILFFLTSKSLVRPFLVPKHPVHSRILRALPGDNDLTDNKPATNIGKQDTSKLFQIFLEFLSKFDFEKYAICFPLSRPVPRTIVADVLNDKDYSYSSIWIMNTSCTWNYTADVREKESKFFLDIVNKFLQEF